MRFVQRLTLILFDEVEVLICKIQFLLFC